MHSIRSTYAFVLTASLLVGMLGCSDTPPDDRCTSGDDCATGEVCINGDCSPRESCTPGETRACTCDGLSGTQECAPSGEGFGGCMCSDADAGSQDGGSDAGAPDAGPIDCTGVEPAGWNLCEETASSCEIDVSDGTGCPAACAALGLRCGESVESIDGMCAPDPDLPPLDCAETGHISDYCVCVRDDLPPADAGVDGGLDGGGELDGGVDAGVDGGGGGSGSRMAIGRRLGDISWREPGSDAFRLRPDPRRAVAGCEIVVDFVERHAAIRIDPVGLGDVDQALRGP